MIVFVASCYSWTLGPGAAGDAAGSSDAGHPDAGDGGGDAPGRRDGRSDGHDASERDGAGAPSRDARPDRTADASCASLLATAGEARAEAVTCTLGTGECETSVLDPCGCKVFVASASSATTTHYVAAVKAVATAGCAPTCTGTCTVATVGACLQTFSEGGVSSSCMP